MYSCIWSSIAASVEKINKNLFKKLKNRAAEESVNDKDERDIFFIKQLEEMYDNEKVSNIPLKLFKSQQKIDDSLSQSHKGKYY